MSDETFPLEDPDYTPAHPPINGRVPEVIEKWGPASQLRWFDRFRDQLKPRPMAEWDRWYCTTTAHTGSCCSSCQQDQDYGYGDDIDGCCCKGFKS